jgi:hypothetical protein
MMEAVRTSETSVYTNETIRIYIPDDFNLVFSWYDNGILAKPGFHFMFFIQMCV